MDEYQRPNYTERQRIRKRLAAIGAPCAICGKPIDYTLDWWIDPKDGKRKKHPYSFEYDHRVPFAKGGLNDWENAQAAHRICNQRKGDEKCAKSGQKRAKKCTKMKKNTGKILPTSRVW